MSDKTMYLPTDSYNNPVPLISLEEDCITQVAGVSTVVIDCHEKTLLVFDTDVRIYITGVPFMLSANNIISVQKLPEITVDILYANTGYIKV